LLREKIMEKDEKVVIFNPDQCSGCRVCELVCSMEKHGEYNPKKSFIRIMANEETGVYIAILDYNCDFCNKCIESCPLDALRISELGEAIIERKDATIGSFPIPVSSVAEV
jgi:Fe-S-cluster-containing dehydrogenase component